MKKIRVLIDGSWLAANRGKLSAKLGRELALDYGALPKVLADKAIKALGLIDAVTVEVMFFSSYPVSYDVVDEVLVARKLAFFDVLKNRFKYKTELYPLNFMGHRISKEFRGDFIPHEKQVDTALATSLVSGALDGSFDIAICVCGDRDFLPPIAIARKHCKVVIASITGSCAHEFTHGNTVDSPVIWLDGILEAIERTRGSFCSSVRHPAALPRAFRQPVALPSTEACLCPLCASLERTLRARAVVSLSTPCHGAPVGGAAIGRPHFLVGTVYRLVPDRGFGFLATPDKRSFYFHVSQLSGLAWGSVKCGLSLLFEVVSEPSANSSGKCVHVRPAYGTP